MCWEEAGKLEEGSGTREQREVRSREAGRKQGSIDRSRV
jgi:hypothetical protein